MKRPEKEVALLPLPRQRPRRSTISILRREIESRPFSQTRGSLDERAGVSGVLLDLYEPQLPCDAPVPVEDIRAPSLAFFPEGEEEEEEVLEREERARRDGRASRGS